MESWSFNPKGIMGSMNWVSKPPFLSETNVGFSQNAMSIENRGFGETCFPQIVGISLLSPVLDATHNAIHEEQESSSELSSSVVESNSRETGLFDLIANNLSSAQVYIPSKQKRIVGFNSRPSFCKVHGCNESLVSCKDYHKRHKVCELHSKTATVIVSGIEQRFCQQCSRFHLLSEFDDGKRSCRKRLADHNERRRKPHSSRHGRLRPPYSKGSTRTRAQSSSMSMSSITCSQQYPSLHDDDNRCTQASISGLCSFLYEDPTGGEDDVITIDSTSALTLLSSQSSWSNPVMIPLIQNADRASGLSNNMNPLVGSEYMNSENRLWCVDGSTIDLLQ